METGMPGRQWRATSSVRARMLVIAEFHPGGSTLFSHQIIFLMCYLPCNASHL